MESFTNNFNKHKEQTQSDLQATVKKYVEQS